MDFLGILMQLFGKRVVNVHGAYVEQSNREVVRYVEPGGRYVDLDLLYGPDRERLVFERDLVEWTSPGTGDRIQSEDRLAILELIAEYCTRAGETMVVRAN